MRPREPSGSRHRSLSGPRCKKGVGNRGLWNPAYKRKPVLFEHNSINKGANAGRAIMQRHRSQPVHGPLFSASEQEHNVVLSASTSPMMRGEDLMVWEPALQIAPRARGGGPQGDQWGPAKRPPGIRSSGDGDVAPGHATWLRRP